MITTTANSPSCRTSESARDAAITFFHTSASAGGPTGARRGDQRRSRPARVGTGGASAIPPVDAERAPAAASSTARRADASSAASSNAASVRSTQR